MNQHKYVIEAQNVIFDYDNFRALDNICLQIKPNTITALVGPNGAGKTTLLRCLAAIEKPLSGQILIDGQDTNKNERSLYKKIGYLSDFFGLYDDLTVEKCLKYAAWSKNLYEEVDLKIADITEKLDLKSLLDKDAHSLSRGQRQRLGIAQAIIHHPKILFLDEPASGLDPKARYKLSKLLLDLKNQNMTIIVSSHILSELEDYCDHMIIVKNGQINKDLDLNNKIDEFETVLITINLVELTKQHLEIITNYDLVTDYKLDNNHININFKGNKKQRSEMLKYLIENKIPIADFSTQKQSFESIYMKNV